MKKESLMTTNNLKQLANQYGYDSVNQMCRQNKVDPQRVYQMIGNKSRGETIGKLAQSLKVKEKDLAEVLKREYLLKVIKENQLSPKELEALFIEVAR